MLKRRKRREAEVRAEKLLQVRVACAKAGLPVSHLTDDQLEEVAIRVTKAMAEIGMSIREAQEKLVASYVRFAERLAASMRTS